MKTIEDVKSALTKLDDGQDLYEVVSNAILQERNKGKGLVTEVQRKVDAYLGGLKTLGFDPQTGDLDGFTGEIKGRLENGKDAGKKLTDTEKRLLEMEKTISSLGNKYSESEEKARKYKQSRDNAVIKDALLSKLKGKIYSAEIHAKDIIREGLAVLDEDGQTVLWKNGDDNTDLSKGLQTYMDSHKDDIVNAQKGGGGGSASSGEPSGKLMNRSAFMQLSPSERVVFTKEGGKLND